MQAQLQPQSLGALDRRAFAREHVVQGSLPLTHGSVLRIEDGADLVVYVWEGEAWITQDGDATDYVVPAGGWMRLDRNGTAIVCAMARTAITLTAPEPAFFATRILHFRAGSAEPRVLYDAGAARADGWAAARAWLRRRWASLFVERSLPTTAAL